MPDILVDREIGKGPYPVTVTPVLSPTSSTPVGTTIATLSGFPVDYIPAVDSDDKRFVVTGNPISGWSVTTAQMLDGSPITIRIRGRGLRPTLFSFNGSTSLPTPGAFTMTQLASPNQVYQRQTTTGGGQGKGAGTIPVTINVSTPGPIFARCRASNGTILQASRSVLTTSTTGSQTANITGVDARLGWFYLDLSADGSTWQNGTVLVGLGGLSALSGQSQAVRELAKMPSYSGTNASLGVTIEPNSAVFARYTDSSRTLSTPAWAVPADSSNYDSTFVAEFLRRKVADKGVNWGVIGHAVGSTSISAWLAGTQNNIDLRAVLDAAGGFEEFYWHQGGDDAGAGTSAASYQSGLSSVFGDLASHNAARGSNFTRYVTTMATRLTGGAGTVANVQTIRKAAADWAAANSATYLEPHDINLEDDVHQGQPGNIILARHLFRATSAATDTGPTISSGTRSGAVITLTASAALSLVGNVANRFTVYPTGSTTGALTVSTAAVSGTTITLTLSADPGTGALDVYWLRHPDPSGTTAAANMIYDTYTTDGLPNGRQLQPTLTAPVAIAATSGGGSGTPNAKINFADPTYTNDVAGWNRWNAPQGGTGGPPTPATLTIVDPTGAATPWTATVTAYGDYGYGQPGTTTGNNSGIFPDDILLKYWFNSTGNTTFRINGLTVGKSYTLTLVGSRGATNRPVIYTVAGVSQNFDAANNTTRSAVFTFTATDTFVDVTFGKGSGGTFGYLNGATFVQNN